MRLIVRKLLMKAGWWDAPLTLQDLAKAICKLYIFFIYLKHFYNFITHIYIVFAAWKMKGGKKKKEEKNFLEKFRQDLFSRIYHFQNFREDLFSWIDSYQIFRKDLISRIWGKFAKIVNICPRKNWSHLRYIKVIWIMW